MMQLEALATLDVVTSLISIFRINAHIFFNHGATYSFVSRSLVVQVCRDPTPLNSTINASTLIGESMLLTQVWKGCVITIDD